MTTEPTNAETTTPPNTATPLSRRSEVVGERPSEPNGRGAAEGGGDRRPLVVIGSNPATPDGDGWGSGLTQPDPDRVGPRLRRLLADRARTLIGETCGDLAEAKQIRTCGVNVTRGLSDVAVEHHPKGYAYTTGLQTCGSVWACPICSFKVRTKRAAEIAAAIAAHKAKGGSVLLLTLTTQHSFGESLAEVWEQVQECWSFIIKHYRYRQLRKQLGLGFIRTMEVMHGRNGWHPHLHILLFTDVEIDPFDTRDTYHEISRIFHDLWVHRMADKYDRDVRSSYGVDLRMVKADDAAGVGTYCTKAGYEVAMADGKEGRTRSSRHPFAIAYDAVETGDVDAINLYREWVQGSHGRHMWSWSNGLREACGLGQEKTAEELAAEADETVGRICTISRTLWRKITATRIGLRAQFLTVLDSGPAALREAIGLLATHGLAVEVETRSPGLPPRLRLDGEPRETPAPNNTTINQKEPKPCLRTL